MAGRLVIGVWVLLVPVPLAVEYPSPCVAEPGKKYTNLYPPVLSLSQFTFYRQITLSVTDVSLCLPESQYH